jgi:hypothetical protein
MAARPTPRGYTRIDQPENNNHGWFVRVGYFKRRDGTWKARHVKFFGDFTYGGKTKARKAAEAFVARVQREDRKTAKTAAKTTAKKTAKKTATKKSARKTTKKSARRRTRR